MKKRRIDDGRAYYWQIIWLFTAFVCGSLLFIAAQAKFDTVTHHNVKILRQLDVREWRMSSDEDPDFVFRGCPDFPNADVIWAGYIADKASWEERGACKSIRADGLGFWYREGHDEYRRIN